MPASDDDLAKLPTWARDEILTLRGQIDDFKMTLQREPAKGADIFIEPPFAARSLDKRYGVPRDSQVSFHLGNTDPYSRGHLTAGISRERKHKMLRIQSAGTLIVRPYSSNMVYIEDVSRWPE